LASSISTSSTPTCRLESYWAEEYLLVSTWHLLPRHPQRPRADLLEVQGSACSLTSPSHAQRFLLSLHNRAARSARTG
jgi:hypothetical protein